MKNYGANYHFNNNWHHFNVMFYGSNTIDQLAMTWQNGRQLKRINKGTNEISYKYNESGLRTSKNMLDKANNYNRETKYFYDQNDKLTGIYGLFGNTMHFYYNTDGSLNSLSYIGETYYYVTNLQGDVTKLVKGDGTVAANYTYDVWGKLIAVTDANGSAITSSLHVALTNPFRYRSYIYDDDTGLYYLQSRLYDPTTGRFINSDMVFQLKSPLGANLFAYCENDSVNCTDYSGMARANKDKLRKECWMYKLAESLNMDISKNVNNRLVTFDKLGVNINISVNLNFQINSLGTITFNTNGAQISFNGLSLKFAWDEVTIGYSTKMSQYRIKFFHRTTWIDRGMGLSLVYCPDNYGPYVAINISGSIHHIAAMGLNALIAAVALLVIAAGPAVVATAGALTPVLQQLVGGAINPAPATIAVLLIKGFEYA